MTDDLNPTKLGTKEYWDTVYEAELSNFEEIGDKGEIWFGIESVEKMVGWSLENSPPSENASILEIGSGNGTLLLALREAGYNPSNLVGIDYSADAVRLSQTIAKKHDGGAITFAVCDFLKDNPPLLPHMNASNSMNKWDILMDKGTFDAIALGEKDDKGRSPAANYPIRVQRLLKPGGLFLITSCNFTEEELCNQFSGPETGLFYHSRIQHVKFTFGGRSGSTCSSVAFRKATPKEL